MISPVRDALPYALLLLASLVRFALLVIYPTQTSPSPGVDAIFETHVVAGGPFKARGAGALCSQSRTRGAAVRVLFLYSTIL